MVWPVVTRHKACAMTNLPHLQAAEAMQMEETSLED